MPAASFDLDGTLVTCGEPRDRSFRNARAEIGENVPLPGIDAYRAAFREALGSRLPDRAPDTAVRREAFKKVFAAEAGVSESTLEAFADAYRRRRLDRLIQVSGAHTLLTALSETRSVVVVTNGPAALQREKLRRTELFDAVDAVAVAGECGTRKPDPELFEIAFDRVGARTRGAVHVGDARPDVEGARAAGLEPILFSPGVDDSRPVWLSEDVSVCDSLDAIGRRLLDTGFHSPSS